MSLFLDLSYGIGLVVGGTLAICFVWLCIFALGAAVDFARGEIGNAPGLKAFAIFGWIEIGVILTLLGAFIR